DSRYGLVPMPRRTLEPVFAQGLQAFQDAAYWGHDYVGLGPYKLDHWELGSQIDASAFDGHVLGRPKIDRIRLMFISDTNAAFANLLAGSTDVALDTIAVPQMLQLNQEW